MKTPKTKQRDSDEKVEMKTQETVPENKGM
jgi:hypothetical protein